jgi:hypothetical protein
MSRAAIARDAPALQHDVIDAARQAGAHCKAGLSGPDDRNVGAPHGSVLLPMSPAGRVQRMSRKTCPGLDPETGFEKGHARKHAPQ